MIQRFEFCVELFWKKEKFMKRLLDVYCLTAISLVLTGCWGPKDREENDTKKREGKMTMTMARTKTDSGLIYEVIKEGTGVLPQAGQRVTVHYTGWLDKNGEPGTKFDSSVDRGQPFTFIIGIGQVIKGWDEGVMSMKIGEKRRLIIPSDLGYGTRGAGNVIPPDATLIFEVELLNVS